MAMRRPEPAASIVPVIQVPGLTRLDGLTATRADREARGNERRELLASGLMDGAVAAGVRRALPASHAVPPSRFARRASRLRSTFAASRLA